MLHCFNLLKCRARFFSLLHIKMYFFFHISSLHFSSRPLLLFTHKSLVILWSIVLCADHVMQSGALIVFTMRLLPWAVCCCASPVVEKVIGECVNRLKSLHSILNKLFILSNEPHKSSTSHQQTHFLINGCCCCSTKKLTWMEWLKYKFAIKITFKVE